MPQKPDPFQQEIFQIAQELGSEQPVASETSDEEAPPTTDVWTQQPTVQGHADVPEDVFWKVYDELTALLRHLQDKFQWPAYQSPWETQRGKILTAYGMTVDGFYEELRQRNEAKSSASDSTPEEPVHLPEGSNGEQPCDTT